MFRIFNAARFVAAGAICVAAAMGHSGTAAAQDAAKATSQQIVLVIDTERLRRESLAGKGVDLELQKYGKIADEENRKAAVSLRASDQELQKERQTLPPVPDPKDPKAQAFAQKADALQQRMNEAERAANLRRQALEVSYQTAIEKVHQAMLDVAREIASSHNADMVVQSQALIFFAPRWDITNEVLAALDKRLPAVDFPPPKFEAAAAAPAAPAAAAADPNAAEKPAADKPKKEKPQKLQLNLQPDNGQQ